MTSPPLLQSARRERDHLMSTAEPALQSSLVSALVALHRVLSSSEALDPGLHHVRRLCRSAGRRLEAMLDAPLLPPGLPGGHPQTPGQGALVSQFVEPDLLPLTDALAGFVGRCAALQARADGTEDGERGLGAVGDAVAVVVEEDLGPALLALGLFGFEVPRPFLAPFDPRRHQLVERAAGPKDVVVDLQRFGRVGRGGRLLEPALVIVGGGS